MKCELCETQSNEESLNSTAGYPYFVCGLHEKEANEYGTLKKHGTKSWSLHGIFYGSGSILDDSVILMKASKDRPFIEPTVKTITCPNNTCGKSNDTFAKCCWWCGGRLSK